MLVKLKNNSFFYTEIIDFWKIPINLDLDILQFTSIRDIPIIIKNNTANKKIIAIYRSNSLHSQKNSKLYRIRYEIRNDRLFSLIDNKYHFSRFFRDSLKFNIFPEFIYDLNEWNSENKFKTLLSFYLNGKKYPFVLISKNILIISIDLEKIFALYLWNYLDKYLWSKKIIKRPLFTLLPFNYRLLPKTFKKMYGTLIKYKLRKRFSSFNKFLEWPLSFDIELLRISLIYSIRILISNPLPYISFWPDNYKGAVLLSFDFDSLESFRNFKYFIKKDSFIFNNSTIFHLTTSNNLNYAINLNKFLSRRFNIEFALHGYNHDSKMIFLTQKKFNRRIQNIFNKYNEKKGFRAPQLLITSNKLKMIAQFIKYDSSFTRFKISDYGFTGTTKINPYRLYLKKDSPILLEIPITIPFEYEYTLLKINSRDALKISKNIINSIINLRGIISLLFHPERELSLNNNWLEYYHTIIDYLEIIAKKQNLLICNFRYLRDITEFRNNLKLEYNSNQNRYQITLKKKEIKKNYDSIPNYQIKYIN